MGHIYDVFVSYSQADHQWVTEDLLPELEQKNPKLRVCIHERDFKVLLVFEQIKLIGKAINDK